MIMNFSWTSLKHWLGVAGAAFVGAAAGYGEAHLSGLTSGQWRPVLGGAILAGISAAFGLGQIPSPQKMAKMLAMENSKVVSTEIKS
jgi:hypothetical protein